MEKNAELDVPSYDTVVFKDIKVKYPLLGDQDKMQIIMSRK